MNVHKGLASQIKSRTVMNDTLCRGAWDEGFTDIKPCISKSVWCDNLVQTQRLASCLYYMKIIINTLVALVLYI